MANEIELSASLQFTKATKTASKSTTNLLLDMTGGDYYQGTQSVAITEEALQLGDITTPGLIWVRNLDSTNFMEFRPATGVADCVKVLAGETQLFRFTSAAPFVIADTAIVEIEYLLLEA